MKVTITMDDHEITYSTTTRSYRRTLVVGTTTRYGLRVKCLDLPRLGWMNACYVSIKIEDEDKDMMNKYSILPCELIRVNRGKHRRYPKAKPMIIFKDGTLRVGVDLAEICRIRRLCNEIDRFTEMMRSRKGLRTVAVAKMRQKAERKRQRRERLAIDAFIRRYGPVEWSLLNHMYKAAGC